MKEKNIKKDNIIIINLNVLAYIYNLICLEMDYYRHKSYQI